MCSFTDTHYKTYGYTLTILHLVTLIENKKKQYHYIGSGHSLRALLLMIFLWLFPKGLRLPIQAVLQIVVYLYAHSSLLIQSDSILIILHVIICSILFNCRIDFNSAVSIGTAVDKSLRIHTHWCGLDDEIQLDRIPLLNGQSPSDCITKKMVIYTFLAFTKNYLFLCIIYTFCVEPCHIVPIPHLPSVSYSVQ